MSAQLINTEDGAMPTGWECFGKAYGVHEESYQMVSTETLAALLKAEHTLQVMMKHAVHQWEGFEDAMIEAQRVEAE